MKLKSSPLPLLIGLTGLLACEGKPKTKTKIVEVEKTYNFTKTSYGTPITLGLSDTGCRADASFSLFSSAIDKVVHNEEETLTTTIIIQKNSKSSTQKISVEEKNDLEFNLNPEPLYTCRSNLAYREDSKEFVALAMKNQVESAYTRYQEVLSKVIRTDLALDLPPLKSVTLNVTPVYKTIDRLVNENGKATETLSVETDNATYGLNRQLEPTISSYMQSKESQSLNIFNGMPLWKIPGVFQHEYGHHIFATFFASLETKNFLDYKDFVSSHPEIHEIYAHPQRQAQRLQSPSYQAALSGFVSSPSFLYGALNEGFADLWAFYTLKNDPNTFNIKCFANDRQVSSSLFSNGIEKKWDSQAWSILFENKEKEVIPKSSNDCGFPSLGEIHFLGAVFAHTIDAAFQSVASSAYPSQDAASLKAEMSLVWLKTLASSFEVVDLSSRATLSRMTNTALGTAKAYLGTESNALFCNTVKLKFPFLLERWSKAETAHEDINGISAFCPR